MYITYIVKENDKLDEILSEFDISKEQLLSINNLSTDILKPGMELKIPLRQNNNFLYYRVKKGDDLYKISQDNLIDVELLAEINGLKPYDYLYENQLILIPRKGLKLYITKEGDTLENIALSNNVSIEELISNNETIYLLPEQLLLYF